MFRIEFFVKDQKLAEILRLLDGKAYNLKSQPVADQLGVDGPKVDRRGKAQKPGSKADKIRIAINAYDGEFRVVDIARAAHTKESNVRSTLKPMVRDGIVKRLDKGLYIVMGDR